MTPPPPKHRVWKVGGVRDNFTTEKRQTPPQAGDQGHIDSEKSC